VKSECIENFLYVLINYIILKVVNYK
jgi:hypothetical protein